MLSCKFNNYKVLEILKKCYFLIENVIKFMTNKGKKRQMKIYQITGTVFYFKNFYICKLFLVLPLDITKKMIGVKTMHN